MQRKSKGFVQLEWVCPNCDARNPGPEKTCQKCGAPQQDNVQFQRAAEEKIITDEKSAAAAKVGADIHCGFCGTRNPGNAVTCSQCGADLKEGKARQSGNVLQAAPTPPKVVRCPNCATENPGTASTCSNCGAPLTKTVTPPPAPVKPAAVPAAKPKGMNFLLLGGIAAFLVVCCVAILFLFVFPSRTVDGTVANLYWQTSVPLQEVRPVDHNNERGNPPSDAYNVSCRTEEQEVCEQKTIDKGNGYGEVVEDCHTETDQFCSYTVDEWTTIQTYDLDGNDLYPVYADPTLSSSDQRIGSSSVTMNVYFDTSDGRINYTPNSLNEFQQFEIGSIWKLSLNAVGGVVKVEK
ncbi:MAG TPA: zinc ribbon domain-containing protein [Anaerolineales bacterium]|nr:zinc ribbon domain-containing protein [Anaerolineales bacterium]